MPETVEQMVAEFGEHASPGSWFLSKERDIEEHPTLLPYSHYLRQAWTAAPRFTFVPALISPLR
jgi:hypothetical protein